MSSRQQDGKERLEAAAPLLADWFREHARPLPWRRDRTPYRILVSEIMLQQTRIEAVIDHYLRFTAAWPDVAALASAPEEEILKQWEGLGYYSRARNLLKAARICRDVWGGELPASFAELRKLPGIGEYTAGAVASMGFGEIAAAVDGNVLRVLSRLLADERDVLDPAVKKEARDLLESILKDSGVSPGDFNEGLMELGETLCLPKGSPDCGACPLKALCLSHAAGTEETLPLRHGPKARRIEEKTILLPVCGGKIGLEKRPDWGILAGLYGFPMLEGSTDAGEIPQLLREKYGLSAGAVLRLRDAGSADHIFTHVEWRMRGFLLETGEELPGLTYAAPAELKKGFALPSAFRFYKTVYLREYEE